MDNIKYAAFDPGKTTGYALYAEDGMLYIMSQLYTRVETIEFLKNLPNSITHFIAESYIVRPGVKHGGSDVPAVRVLGYIESEALRRGAFYIEQQPAKKTIGYARLKTKAPSNHAMSHGLDAAAHGEYFLFANRVRERYAQENTNTSD